MSYLGTFDGFTTARLAIIAAQNGLNLTGNNVANISTTGYTRQVLDQVSLRTGANDRYASDYQLTIGTGVLCTGISQIRDPYLDIRYRTEVASVGAYDTWLAGLNDIADVLNEVCKGENDGDGLIMAQISDLKTCINNLNASAGNESYDTLAQSSADALCALFNQYANELETQYNNTVTRFQQDLNEVNEILNNIRDLNSSIRKSEIHGDNALELRDERNRQIDALAEYMKIDVIYEEEDLGGGLSVEKLTIRLGSANPDVTDTENATLIDGVYAVQFEQPENLPLKNEDYDPDYVADPDNPSADDNKQYKYLDGDGNGTNDWTKAAEGVENPNFTLALTALADSKGRIMKVHGEEVEPAGVLDDNDLYGGLQSTRELLTEKGEFATAEDMEIDENAAIKRGYPFYRMALDLLARQIATTLNEANQGYAVDQNGYYLDKTGSALQIDNEFVNKTTGLTDNQKTWLVANDYTDDDDPTLPDLEKYLAEKGDFMGGCLFSNQGDGDDTENITAANISISKSWSTGAIHIVNSFTKLFGGELDDTTQNENLRYMVTLFDKDMVYDPKMMDPDAISDHLFEGSYQEMLDKISSVMGEDQRSTQVKLNTSYSTAVTIDTNRDNVSGVDLNDETMNMMQYQKALTAAYRLMTVLDEALDKLISGTGIVGR